MERREDRRREGREGKVGEEKGGRDDRKEGKGEKIASFDRLYRFR